MGITGHARSAAGSRAAPGGCAGAARRAVCHPQLPGALLRFAAVFFFYLQRVDLLGAMHCAVRFAACSYQLAPSLAVVTASFGTAHRVPLRLQEVREAAVSLVERATKRYTSMAPLVLPPLLAALAKLPPGVVSFACLGVWLHVASVVLISNLAPLRAALVPSCGAWGTA